MCSLGRCKLDETSGEAGGNRTRDNTLEVSYVTSTPQPRSEDLGKCKSWQKHLDVTGTGFEPRFSPAEGHESSGHGLCSTPQPK